MVPGSHLRGEFPSAAYVEKNAVQLEATAGDFLVFDGFTQEGPQPYLHNSASLLSDFLA